MTCNIIFVSGVQHEAVSVYCEMITMVNLVNSQYHMQLQNFFLVIKLLDFILLATFKYTIQSY